MSAIFAALPGHEVPVGEISARLAQLWEETATAGLPAPDRAGGKASQINLVLHFGFGTTPADAEVQFRNTTRFAARYPSRVVVLCPHQPEAPVHEMRAKIYGECFLGRTRHDTRCCEFVLLSYPFAARHYLESQVSICLTPDLPLYYWAHRFIATHHMADYRYLLNKAQRFLFDSGASPADAIGYPWPRPETVRDLALARLLPVRQSLGQFLARYTPAQLAGNLAHVTLAHSPAYQAEGAALLRWISARLHACGARPTQPAEIVPAMPPSDLCLTLHYADAATTFQWCGSLASGEACLAANYGGQKTSQTIPIQLLTPEMALADAMFF